MGCGGNCACANKSENDPSSEIISAVAPDGTDVTEEVQSAMKGESKKGDENCQKGKCEKCQSE